jgi:NAD-specific glutamate dehydrogenase
VTQDELKHILEKVLPKDHPVLEHLDQPIKRATDVQDLVRTTESVLEILEDWKRGIRDWEEVEEVLFQANAELILYKETTR